MMKLNNIFPNIFSKFNIKRIGRGIGSGIGKTSGRGHKGQKSRSGSYRKFYFEGGQTPIGRRIPKFGFFCRKNLYFQELKLCDLNFSEINIINIDILKKIGLVRRNSRFIKIVFKGSLNKVFKVYGIKYTKNVEFIFNFLGGSLI